MRSARTPSAAACASSGSGTVSSSPHGTTCAPPSSRLRGARSRLSSSSGCSGPAARLSASQKRERDRRQTLTLTQTAPLRGYRPVEIVAGGSQAHIAFDRSGILRPSSRRARHPPDPELPRVVLAANPPILRLDNRAPGGVARRNRRRTLILECRISECGSERAEPALIVGLHRDVDAAHGSSPRPSMIGMRISSGGADDARAVKHRTPVVVSVGCRSLRDWRPPPPRRAELSHPRWRPRDRLAGPAPGP